MKNFNTADQIYLTLILSMWYTFSYYLLKFAYNLLLLRDISNGPEDEREIIKETT